MLDHVSISHQSGLILWSKSFTPAFSALTVTPASPINALVKETFIEGKATNEQEGFERDGYSVRWTMENGLGLVFVVVFPALLPLTYIPTLLSRTKQLFLSLFEPYLRTLVDSLHGSITASASQALQELRIRIDTERWERIFERCLRDCEGKDQSKKPISLQRQAQLTRASSSASVSGVNASASSQTGSEDKAISAEEIAKNVQALKGRMRGKGRGTPSPTSSPKKPNQNSAAQKLMRKWGDSSVTAEDMASLDYSTPAPAPTSPGGPGTDGTSTPTLAQGPPVDTDSLVSADAMGIRTANGYEVADWDYRREDLPTEDEILARGANRLKISSTSTGTGTGVAGDDEDPTVEGGRWSSMFSRLTGKKTLSQEDLKPVLAEMERHLMDKNVAKDIAEKLCDSVGTALVGKKLGGLTSVKTEVQNALSTSLTRVLTPKTSTDILLDIQRKRSQTLVSDEVSPYTMTFVGVNGVGKSTNLSKVCFWLLQNGYRVLIAACDTFRSGAVEQLRVHVRNLGALAEDLGEGDKERRIELFEKGYGKDAAGIAKDAITYAKENKFDVVLIDTAGRMQDNEPLMRALAKLVTVNNPDKILFVGEALVGNEAVDQLTKFDRALKDFSSAGIGGAQRKRGIDGIILTKFDTIDDKVGAALSMTYVTGQPILFVGCGQTYTDLRHLRVNHIVQALLA